MRLVVGRLDRTEADVHLGVVAERGYERTTADANHRSLATGDDQDLVGLGDLVPGADVDEHEEHDSCHHQCDGEPDDS